MCWVGVALYNYSFGLNLMEGNQNLMFPELIATQDTSIYITVFKCLGSHETDEYIYMAALTNY